MEWEHSYMQETKMPIKIPKLSYIKPWIVLCFTILAFKAYIVNIRRTLNVLIWSILNFNIDSGTTNRKSKSEYNICLSNEKKKLWDRLHTFPYGLFYLQTHLQNMFHQPLPPPTCMHAKKKWQTANLDTEGAIYFTSAIYNQDKAFKPLRLRPISLLQVQLKKYLRTVSKSMEINFLKCLKWISHLKHVILRYSMQSTQNQILNLNSFWNDFVKRFCKINQDPRCITCMQCFFFEFLCGIFDSKNFINLHVD